jgi:tRNA A-37 threonylcarbamoyl transferase component Bud32
LAAVPILLLLLRRRGELVVVIDYPPELRGNFRVRVAREAERAPSERPTAAAGAARAPASAPKSTRTERFQVAREAQFPKLAAGRYWVVVEGQLCDASGERVQPCFAQRQARVERGRTLRVDFEFAPVTLPEVDEAGAVAQSPTRIEELRKRAEAQAALATRLRAATQAAPVVTSRYEILGEIGRGGMAVVYRARDTRLDRIVALKRISDSLREHPRAVDLLLREARSAAGLNHPHIVTIHDVDQQDGSYFITMEFLEGKPLHELLRLRGRFAARPVAHIGQQVVAGLAYAHERRIVHRDVKTANLFVTRGNVVKIMDFGLAKMVEEVRRRATMIGGTPSYMAPEQSRGLEVDGRADLYAFGVTLFELLTGRLPFEDGDVVQHHRETPPPDPRASAPDVPDALAELVLALLAKRPEDRPAAADVAARLRDVERGAPGAA